MFFSSMASQRSKQNQFLFHQRMDENCNPFEGKWVWDNVSYPLYKENSCPYLVKQTSCLKNGRPDSFYQNWRWQPNACKLPRYMFPWNCKPSILSLSPILNSDTNFISFFFLFLFGEVTLDLYHTPPFFSQNEELCAQGNTLYMFYSRKISWCIESN